MLGLVFARFSAPFKRAASIRFSNTVTVSRHSTGFWALTFRCVMVWVWEGGWVCVGGGCWGVGWGGVG